MVPVGGGIAFTLALLCAAVMGLAIQRGATCTVAAVEDLLAGGKQRRLLALVEAALWVGVGLLVVRELIGPMALPVGYALNGWTLAGATLLGAGALVNGACVFGAIARLGSGQWAYGATPLGFYVGCLSVIRVFGPAMPQALAGDSPILAAPTWLVWTLATAVALRGAWSLRSRGAQAWSPHTATAVIGLAFLALFLLSGAWAYTDVLADLARGMAHSLGERLALALAVLIGASASGVLARSWRSTRPTASATLRCFCGGVLMGWGSLLIPGGNDGLVLVGMPLLWPYAWTSFAVMCLVIGLGLWTRGHYAGITGKR
jgi:toxin CptA